jgi:outer membrane protein OmpU
MNKLKKIGLSALAGSLAAFSANAVEYAVTGDAYVSYQSEDSVSSETGSGKNFSADMDLYFTASTELDNGFDITFFQAVNTDSTLAVTSMQVTLGMGSLGTLQLNEHGGSKANGIDDVMPNAMQETWDRVDDVNSSDPSFFGSSTASGSIDYRIPTQEFAGTTINASITYDPNSGEAAANATSGGIATNVPGTAYTLQVSNSGLEIGGGIEMLDDDQGLAKASGTENTTVYAKYSYGPLTVGYQEAYKNARNAVASLPGADTEVEMWGAAYTVNDITFSYGESELQVKGVGATAAGSVQQWDSLQAAYSMGAMTISAALSEGSNVGGTANANYEETSVAVNFAF